MSSPTESLDGCTLGDDSRDNELFLELLAQHEAQLLGFLCAIVRNYQDAEDLLQQTILTMWQKFAEFEPGTNFAAWGCRIARFKAMNLMRSRKEALLDDSVIDLLAEAQDRQSAETRLARRRALAECVGKLSTKDNELIRAAYTNKSTIKNLADELGRSQGGVYNSLARIRSSLYRCIQATLAQEGSL